MLALFCLVVAGVVEWKLVNVESGPFNEPLTVPAQSEVITFQSPRSAEKGPFTFSYTPASAAKRVLLEAYFDNAQLSQETVQKFQLLEVSAPTAPGVISYLTTGEGESACATAASVNSETDNPASMSFREPGNNPNYGYRSLGVTFHGTDTIVTFATEGAESGQSTCKFDLKVGDWEQPTPGAIAVKVRVLSGSGFRLHWHDLADPSDEWTKRLPGQSLLDFGSTATDGFTASGVSVNMVDSNGQAEGTPKFDAEASRGSIAIGSFRINRNQLEMTVDGTGVLKRDGKVVSHTNVLSAITANPLLATGFGALNLALINWVRRSFAPARQPTASDSAHA